MFDENNNEKIFIGSKCINPVRKSAHRLRKGVDHKGKDLVSNYTLNIPTLFSSARMELQEKLKTGQSRDQSAASINNEPGPVTEFNADSSVEESKGDQGNAQE